MDIQEQYKETLPLTIVTLIVAMLGITTITLLIMLIYNELSSSISIYSEPSSLYFLIMFLVLLVITTFFINFRKLSIIINSQYIEVRFGLFKTNVQWNNIEKCSEIKESRISYTGWGIRTMNIEGVKSKAYITSNCPQVMLQLKTSELKELVFSTKHQQKVLDIINKRIANAE